MSYLEVISEGYDKVGFIDVDVRNDEMDKRNVVKDFDAQMILEHFSDLQ